MDKNKIMVVVAVVLIGVLLWWQPWSGGAEVDPCAAHDADQCGADAACVWTDGADGAEGSCASVQTDDTDDNADDNTDSE